MGLLFGMLAEDSAGVNEMLDVIAGDGSGARRPDRAHRRARSSIGMLKLDVDLLNQTSVAPTRAVGRNAR